MTPKKMLFAAVLTALAIVGIAPSAIAQSLPNTGDVGNTVGGATDTVDNATGGATGGVTDTVNDTVDETVDDATDTVNDTTDTVNDTTGDTTDTVDEATGGATGGASDVVNDTTGGATDAVNDTVNGANGSGEGAGGGSGGGGVVDPVTDTVNGAIGNSTGSTPGTNPGAIVDEFFGGGGSGGAPNLDNLAPDMVDDLVDQAATFGLSPAAAEGWIDGRVVGGGTTDPSAVLGSFTHLFDNVTDQLITATSGPGSSSFEVTLSARGGDSFLDKAGRAAVAAAKTLAFPLALALMVVGFLAVQGRIGRKDPKLALAPVDGSQESLTFE